MGRRGEGEVKREEGRGKKKGEGERREREESYLVDLLHAPLQVLMLQPLYRSKHIDSLDISDVRYPSQDSQPP